MFPFLSLLFILAHSFLLHISFSLAFRQRSFCFTGSLKNHIHSNALRSEPTDSRSQLARLANDINPKIDCSRNKPPAIYHYEDLLSDYRIDKFKPLKDVTHFTSLPYVEIEHQDKGKLIRFRDGRDIVAFYANKLNALLSNFTEWSKAFSEDKIKPLDNYNPLASDTYYAVVYYCAWQSESIALVRAIRQLLGRWRWIRDPPIRRNEPEPTLDEILEKVEKMKKMHEEHELAFRTAREQGLPDPPEPIFSPAEQVTFNMRIPNLNITKRILEHASNAYKSKWWMPKFAKIAYNRLFDKGFSELYNTSLKRVLTADDRMKYKLRECDASTGDPATRPGSKKAKPKPININFIMVRLANSLMLANSRRGLMKQKKMVLAHEKEVRFNEIILDILIKQEAYYKSMPLVQLFKCANPIQNIPSVVPAKTHEKMPFDEPTFYRHNPFDIAEKLTYGLPPLRKFTHLAIADDFEHVGNIMDLATLDVAKSVDDVFTPVVDLPNTNFIQRYKGIKRDGRICAGLDPVLYALSMMYRFHLKKIIDARPVPAEYYYMNP
ncbi:signal peptide-containing protein [Theileria equi strain WA]|uniref:Signal peptide-containing protein n=1 Tax=Theileria equi strain WA TaxID=1537102 RepID=L0AZ19_THEEQ|nr:signal peptide-containing protein [Theileria equi strain WA]AFZ80144.1 signal peptide-containing protein [Theileria equi strain WA]|eukprot:XP_004829810.1 signal peptide-containing protein [Theileria equi strain WA]